MYNFRKGIFSYLLRNNFHVIVVAPKDSYVSNLINLGVEYIPLEQLNSKGANPWKDYIFYKELITLYTQLAPDIIFHYTIKPNIYGTLAAKKVNIPSIAIVTGLGYTFTHKNLVSRVALLLYKKALSKANETWFLNPDDKQTFIDNKITSESKSFTLPGEGVDTTYFKPVENEGNGETGHVKFILIARMIYDKGVEEFVNASKILKKRGHDFDSLLLGFMDVINPRAITKEKMSEWEKEGLVKYLGATDDVVPFIHAADCIVLPSFYREGIPRTLLEGASMAKALITTDNVGCKEVVDNNITGYLCKMKDPVDLADKMEAFIMLSMEEKKEMGIKGRDKMISMFDEERVISIYEEKIRKILKI